MLLLWLFSSARTQPYELTVPIPWVGLVILGPTWGINSPRSWPGRPRRIFAANYRARRLFCSGSGFGSLALGLVHMADGDADLLTCLGEVEKLHPGWRQVRHGTG